MDLAHRKLIIVFILATAAFLLLPPIFPGARLYYYAPFLVISYYQSRLISSLWSSLLCGVLVDFFSDLPFGVNALVYTMTTAVLYRQRRHFFSDKAMTLAVMTILFAWLSTVGLWIMVYLLGIKLEITSAVIFGDFIIMPLNDAAYSFIIFTLPYFFWGKRIRRGSEYFL